MYRHLCTEFSIQEVAVLKEFRDKHGAELLVVHGVDVDQFQEKNLKPIRMVQAGAEGGYYVAELEGNEGVWELGVLDKNGYSFLSPYNSLSEALYGM